MARNLKENIILYLKGMSMGAADVIPGVSGGTIAFITGIYDELIQSIRAVLSKRTFELLSQKDFRSLFKYFNISFLVVLLAGVGTSIISLAKLMEFSLEHYPVFIWSFFFGLIISSAILVFKKINQWNTGVVISTIAGIIIAYMITVISPASTPEDLWFIFLSGAVAICAMILPGISGSFILLLMGKYEYIISALTTLNFKVIITFSLGCVTGILAFSHVLNWLLKKYHDLTVGMLAGFMIGSLNKVWPWKEVLTTYTDRHGEIKPLTEMNVAPFGSSTEIIAGFGLMLFGFVLVIAIETYAKRKPKLVSE